MFNEIKREIVWNGNLLTLSTGKFATQADGAVMVSMGDTMVLCTCVANKSAKEDATFFPFTVNYREMYYAAGKIPGGFIKREGKSSDAETLISRLIDRPLRPLFHSEFFNETNVICTVVSYDPLFSPDILAMIGASAAVALSGVPTSGIMGAAKVGMCDSGFVLNPALADLKKSALDLVVAGTKHSILMVESQAYELSEDIMLAALEFAHQAMQPVIECIEDLVKVAGKEKMEIPNYGLDSLVSHLEKEFKADIVAAYSLSSKKERYAVIDLIKDKIISKYGNEYSSLKLDLAFEAMQSKVVRHMIVHDKKRIDKRVHDEIRKITCEASLLPRVHGSSLFTRGETQALVSATLGTTYDEQILDGISGEDRDHFILHYIFPPYAVNEAFGMRAPGRREVGHGKLAWRAIFPMLPKKEDSLYTIRVVSEITACNGSSSMATVCGASMAIMDAGINLKAPVAGIAMGLIKEGDDYIILSDIIGDEDHLGDMDFKVAGTANGITAMQMDIKIDGITHDIMKCALEQARDGRLHILNKMSSAINNSKESVSVYAPQVHVMSIDKDKIRDLIGPGGKVIKDICEKTSAKIDISDDGVVKISAVGAENLQMAIKRVMDISYEPANGDIIVGTVVKVIEAGAFVSITQSKDGFLHISEIANARINDINDYVKVGQTITVKVIGFEKGKIKLSLKALDAVADNNAGSKANEAKPSDSDVRVADPVVQASASQDEHHGDESRRSGDSFKRKKVKGVVHSDVITERKYFT